MYRKFFSRWNWDARETSDDLFYVFKEIIGCLRNIVDIFFENTIKQNIKNTNFYTLKAKEIITEVLTFFFKVVKNSKYSRIPY